MRKRSGGMMDNFRSMVGKIRDLMDGKTGQPGLMPRRLIDRSKYGPENRNGAKERGRRIRQMERWWSGEPGVKLGPSSRGVRA